MSKNEEDFMSRQDVVLRIGCAEAVLSVGWNSDADDEEMGDHLAEVIRDQITPDLILGMLTKSAAMNVSEQPRFDPETILKDVTVPFKIVTAATFLCRQEGQDIPCQCRSQEYNSIADFNAKHAGQCIALHSAQKVDEAARLQAQGVTSLEEMKWVLGHGPRILYAFWYAVLTEDLYQNINSEFLVGADEEV